MVPDGDPTHEALLAGVIDDPRADAPRLVYADYLDDRGTDADRERAAFIRAQVHLERLPKDHPDRESLLAFEREILARRAHEWAVPFRPLFWEWSYRRGFIERAHVNLVESTPEGIRALLRAVPLLVVREMAQTMTLRPVVEVLPDLRHLDGLEFWMLCGFEQEDVRRILSSPHLAGLRSLILYHDRNGDVVDDDILVEAMASPLRRNLRELAVNIDDCWRGPSEAVVRAMVASRHLKRVRHLRLQHTRLDMELVAKLFDAMPQLSRLDLHETVLTPNAALMVLERARAGRLRWLRLTGVPLSEEMRAAFDAAPAAIEWERTWRQPFHGGCWRGHTWGDGARAEAAKAADYLRRRDAGGMEAYYRGLCVRHRGEEVARLIEAVPFGEFGRALEEAFRGMVIPAGATALFVSAPEGYPGECNITDMPPLNHFRTHHRAIDRLPLGRMSLPVCPRRPEAAERPGGPLDPDSAGLYYVARRDAAIVRAAGAAGVAVQVVVTGGLYRRLW